jgi:hypothetical protein
MAITLSLKKPAAALEEIDSRNYQKNARRLLRYTDRITTNLIARYLRVDYPTLAAWRD